MHDERTDRAVYEGPDPDLVPGLMQALVGELAEARGVEPMVRAAMAHLNLGMIHPHRDGKGWMARALQTLVLAQGAVLDPTFASIEEWLGSNTKDFYRILAVTGGGRWHPENDAHLWSSSLMTGSSRAQAVSRSCTAASSSALTS